MAHVRGLVIVSATIRRARRPRRLGCSYRTTPASSHATRSVSAHTGSLSAISVALHCSPAQALLRFRCSGCLDLRRRASPAHLLSHRLAVLVTPVLPILGRVLGSACPPFCYSSLSWAPVVASARAHRRVASRLVPSTALGPAAPAHLSPGSPSPGTLREPGCVLPPKPREVVFGAPPPHLTRRLLLAARQLRAGRTPCRYPPQDPEQRVR